MSAVRTYQKRLAVIRDQTAKAVAREWASLPSIDKQYAEPFAKNAAQIVRSGQLLTAKTTMAYTSRTANIRPTRIDPKKVTGPAARKGVDPLEEYQRPFGITWHAMSEGMDFEQAKAMGAERSKVLAVADVWLAMRATTEVIDQANSRITQWVRVADATACELCAGADGLPTDQAADMAGHPNCGCTQEPVMGEADTTPSNPDAYEINEHDELGPMLTKPGQSFAAA